MGTVACKLSRLAVCRALLQQALHDVQQLFMLTLLLKLTAEQSLETT